MTKKLLLEKYIKVAVRKALQEAEEQQKRAERSMYLVYRFPGLKKLMEDLMSPSFGRFIVDVDVIAPKPTTFNAKLVNQQEFNIIYSGKNKFTVKVAGKKYNPQELGELERASQAIADLLELNYAIEEKEAPKKDAGAEAFNVASSAPPAEETPPAEA